MSTVNHRFNYRQLLDHHSLIRIPMIQRDYAHGRPSALQVREEFLAAIEKNLRLPATAPSLPMNLDFIYGSVVKNDDQSRFLPLDGQQRLTTLFLLHWYLAWNDGRLSEFATIFVADGKSRFAYSVRQSSTEFFDALVNFVPGIATINLESLSGFLTNQPWYFRSWRLDPTIKSVLEILDSIHTRFKGSEGLFGRLVDLDRPPITFQLLDLDRFELTDDLYIKMNARGKPLTSFETFKARYEQELKSQFLDEARDICGQPFPIHEFVARRMDTTWIDLFWSKKHQSSAKVDENMLNVFRIVALITRNPINEDITSDLVTLTATLPGYTEFHARGWLDETFTRTLIPLLEFWSSGCSGEPRTALPSQEYFDERRAFSVIKDDARNLDSNETLLLMAYVLFIREHEGDVDSKKIEDWMRVVFNFIVNANIERKERLAVGMSLILSLLPHSGDILKFLSEWKDADDLTGNLKHQAREEMSKAKLIISHSGWRPLILRAERHNYFRGQIQFLLEFSEVMDAVLSTPPSDWDVELHDQFQKSFEKYLARSEAMFNGKGLVSTTEHLWERSLLAIGDYTIDIGSQNRSLLVNAPSEQGSWKRLLRAFSSPEKASRKLLGALLSRLTDDRPFEEQLNEIIETTKLGIDTWRSAIIASPAAFEYGQRKIIRFSEDNLYLPKKTQMNGAHVELFSYCFYKSRLPVLQSEGALGSLIIGEYEPAIGRDVEPFFVLNYLRDRLQCRLKVAVIGMECQIACRKAELEEAPELKNALESLGELTEFGDSFALEVARGRMEESIRQLSAILC